MGGKNYKRTTGGKHKWKKLGWLPVKTGNTAELMDGTRFAMRRDGWRNLDKPTRATRRRLRLAKLQVRRAG